MLMLLIQTCALQLLQQLPLQSQQLAPAASYKQQGGQPQVTAAGLLQEPLSLGVAGLQGQELAGVGAVPHQEPHLSLFPMRTLTSRR